MQLRHNCMLLHASKQDTSLMIDLIVKDCAKLKLKSNFIVQIVTSLCMRFILRQVAPLLKRQTEKKT